jgi:hypothetical protein
MTIAMEARTNLVIGVLPMRFVELPSCIATHFAQVVV